MRRALGARGARRRPHRARPGTGSARGDSPSAPPSRRMRTPSRPAGPSSSPASSSTGSATRTSSRTPTTLKVGLAPRLQVEFTSAWVRVSDSATRLRRRRSRRRPQVAPRRFPAPSSATSRSSRRSALPTGSDAIGANAVVGSLLLISSQHYGPVEVDANLGWFTPALRARRRALHGHALDRLRRHSRAWRARLDRGGLRLPGHAAAPRERRRSSDSSPDRPSPCASGSCSTPASSSRWRARRPTRCTRG